MNLLALQYNKYYNRIIKKENSVSKYTELATKYKWILNCNFNPNDGVSTSHVLNFNENWEIDYLLVVDTNENIVSRWFVVDNIRTRQGQYNLSLKRDSIADNYEQVIQAPAFIEKGMITNPNDIAIYNNEGISFNQIKTNETMLKDKTNVPWIIGFLAPNIEDKTVSVPRVDFQYINVNSLESWQYNKYRNPSTPHYEIARKNIKLFVTFRIGTSPFAPNYPVIFSIGNDNNYQSNYQSTYIFNGQVAYLDATRKEEYYSSFLQYATERSSAFDQVFYNYNEDYSYESLYTKLNNKYIYDSSTSTMYRITVTRSVDESNDRYPSSGSDEERAINNIMTGWSYGIGHFEYDPNNRFNTNIETTYRKEVISLEPVTISQVSFTFKSASNKLDDAPYRMFAIPYGNIKKAIGESTLAMTNKEALSLASRIAEAYGSSNVYDIQLLPFCPLTNNTIEGGVNIAGMQENTDYSFITKEGNTQYGILFYCKYSQFTGDISLTLQCPTDVLEKKIINDCDLYRLACPNFASQFDFNLAKNGTITTFNYDCTYKPYNAYIHVNPNFGGLYGIDFNDYRGLVFQGDYTIPTINNAWTDYVVNNKNYLNAFNRETDSLETSFQLNQIKKMATMMAGISGSLLGGEFGALTTRDNPFTPLGKGALGAAAVGLMGSIDLDYSKALHSEQMANRQDQFNFSMQNIQARPNTLAKGSAFDYNNKLFPVLEYYTCTDTEKQALRDKLTYEGYTINRIGRVIDFIDSTKDYSFVRSRLIRLTDIDGDTHIVQDIATELSLGKYFKGE